MFADRCVRSGIRFTAVRQRATGRRRITGANSVQRGATQRKRVVAYTKAYNGFLGPGRLGGAAGALGISDDSGGRLPVRVLFRRTLACLCKALFATSYNLPA